MHFCDLIIAAHYPLAAFFFTARLDGGAGTYRSALILPIGYEYTNSDWDVRHRVTLNGSYQLPFGQGRRFPEPGRRGERIGRRMGRRSGIRGADRQSIYGNPEHQHGKWRQHRSCCAVA
jgi:hypothetical protein